MRNPRMPADLSAYPERQGFVTKVSPPQLQPKTPSEESTTAKPSRSSTARSRIGRRTCALPVLLGESSMSGLLNPRTGNLRFPVRRWNRYASPRRLRG